MFLPAEVYPWYILQTTHLKEGRLAIGSRSHIFLPQYIMLGQKQFAITILKGATVYFIHFFLTSNVFWGSLPWLILVPRHQPQEFPFKEVLGIPYTSIKNNNRQKHWRLKHLPKSLIFVAFQGALTLEFHGAASTGSRAIIYGRDWNLTVLHLCLSATVVNGVPRPHHSNRGSIVVSHSLECVSLDLNIATPDRWTIQI